jgi:hypothetical protein
MSEPLNRYLVVDGYPLELVKDNAITALAKLPTGDVVKFHKRKKNAEVKTLLDKERDQMIAEIEANSTEAEEAPSEA